MELEKRFVLFSLQHRVVIKRNSTS